MKEKSCYMLNKYQLISVCSLLLLYFITNQINPINALEPFQKNDIFNSSKTLEELKDFALTEINEDRKDFGLEPVVKSNNSAAQIQADEILKTESLSHLTTSGLKPYMLYSLYDGTGYVQQNVAQISYILPTNGSQQNDQKPSDLCNNSNKYYYCPDIDPIKAIEDLEYSMVYNDSKCCNNGHKNNILNKFHTHVSLGIAYNDYSFVIVQNFENQYLDSNYTVEKNKDEIKLQAKILDPNNYNFTINHVSFFLDDHPTKLNYEENKNKNSYELGDLKLMVSKPLPAYEKYVQEDNSYKIVEAEKWDSTMSNINMEMKIPDALSIKNKVLTMVVYGESIETNSDKANENDYIPLTSYTFFNS